MNRFSLLRWILGFSFLLNVNTLFAAMPLWTFSSPSPALVNVAAGQTATVQYTVTNHSRKSKHLVLRNTNGLSASPCYLVERNSTCTLTLTR